MSTLNHKIDFLPLFFPSATQTPMGTRSMATAPVRPTKATARSRMSA